MGPRGNGRTRNSCFPSFAGGSLRDPCTRRRCVPLKGITPPCIRACPLCCFNSNRGGIHPLATRGKGREAVPRGIKAIDPLIFGSSQLAVIVLLSQSHSTLQKGKHVAIYKLTGYRIVSTETNTGNSTLQRVRALAAPATRYIVHWPQSSRAHQRQRPPQRAAATHA